MLIPTDCHNFDVGHNIDQNNKYKEKENTRINMSTKRDSALINFGDDHKRQKINNDVLVKHETMVDGLVRNNMLPLIAAYLPPRDILNCIQTSNEWKGAIDTDYVWDDILLRSIILHLPPSDISTCIQASKKWKRKIDTIDTFWKQVANRTVPSNFVYAVEEQARKVHRKLWVYPSLSEEITNINYKEFALGFDSDKKGTQTKDPLEHMKHMMFYFLKNSQTKEIVDGMIGISLSVEERLDDTGSMREYVLFGRPSIIGAAKLINFSFELIPIAFCLAGERPPPLPTLPPPPLLLKYFALRKQL